MRSATASMDVRALSPAWPPPCGIGKMNRPLFPHCQIAEKSSRLRGRKMTSVLASLSTTSSHVAYSTLSPVIRRGSLLTWTSPASPSLVRRAAASGCISSCSSWSAWSFFIPAPSSPVPQHLAEGLDGAGCRLAEAKNPQIADRCALPTVAHHRQGQVVLGIGETAGAPEPEMAIAAGELCVKNRQPMVAKAPLHGHHDDLVRLVVLDLGGLAHRPAAEIADRRRHAAVAVRAPRCDLPGLLPRVDDRENRRRPEDHRSCREVTTARWLTRTTAQFHRIGRRRGAQLDRPSDRSRRATSPFPGYALVFARSGPPRVWCPPAPAGCVDEARAARSSGAMPSTVCGSVGGT